MDFILALGLMLFDPPQDDPAQEAPELVERLRSKNTDERDKAAQRLLEIGEPAIDALRIATELPNLEQATRARQLLDFINTTSKRLKAFEVGSVEDRRRLIALVRADATIGIHGPPPKERSTRLDLLRLLQMAVSDSDEEVRGLAVWTLADMNHEKALPGLLTAVNRKGDSAVINHACIGLTWLGRSKNIRPSIVAALRETYKATEAKDFYIRFDLAVALFELGAPPEPSVFVEGLRRGNMRALRPMAHFNRKDSILSIITLMARASPDDAQVCGEVLEALTSQKLGDDVVKWYRWFDQNRGLFPDQLK